MKRRIRKRTTANATSASSTIMMMLPNSAPRPRSLISAAMPRPAARPAMDRSTSDARGRSGCARSGRSGRAARPAQRAWPARRRAWRAEARAACRQRRRRRCGGRRRRRAPSPRRRRRGRVPVRISSSAVSIESRPSRPCTAIIRGGHDPNAECAAHRRGCKGDAAAPRLVDRRRRAVPDSRPGIALRPPPSSSRSSPAIDYQRRTSMKKPDCLPGYAAASRVSPESPLARRRRSSRRPTFPAPKTAPAACRSASLRPSAIAPACRRPRPALPSGAPCSSDSHDQLRLRTSLRIGLSEPLATRPRRRCGRA